jgi:rSAM/selenodomain-associated transferase 1
METVPATDVVISYTPRGAEQFFEGIASGRHRLLVQRGRDLGERLSFALEDLLADGYESAAIMNSDSPTLPRKYLKQTFDLLAEPGDRVVVGPAADGGYYLIGLKNPHRRLFDGVKWSTNLVLEQTLERARQIGLDVALLPEWYDVDGASDFERLMREIGIVDSTRGGPTGDTQPNLDGYGVAPHTRAFIKRLASEDGRLADILNVASLDRA